LICLPSVSASILDRHCIGLSLPLASFAKKRSTLETVRLKTTTVKPWSAVFKIRFWPMTARPMRPKSPLGSVCADEPTWMPARRTLKSAGWPCQCVLHDSRRGKTGGAVRAEEGVDMTRKLSASKQHSCKEGDGSG